MARQLICGGASTPLREGGWKSLGVLELTALPSLKEEQWVPWVQEADALLVWGGDVLYLTHWMRQSGVADLLPSLTELVYAGVRAGRIAVTPATPPSAFSTGCVTSSSTCSGASPGASVSTTTWGGANSGKTSYLASTSV